MSNYLQIANKAFQDKDYQKAKQYYGMCFKLKEKEMRLEERQAAFYMLVHVNLKMKNLDEALIYFRQLKNSLFKSEYVPSSLRDVPIYKSLCSELKEYRSQDFIHLNLSDCQLQGDAVNEFVAAIKINPHIQSIDLQGNPLNEEEINLFLDVLVEKRHLTSANLSQLPINRSAAIKIARLIHQEEKKDQAFNLNLNGCIVQDITPIANAIKKSKARAVSISLTSCHKNSSYVSSTLCIANTEAGFELVSAPLKRSDYARNKHLFSKQMEALRGEILKRISKIGLPATSDPMGTQTHTVGQTHFHAFYGKVGELWCFAEQVAGQVFIHIPNPTEVSLKARFFQQFMPCQSLLIDAPGSTLYLSGCIEANSEVNVICQDMTLESNAQLLSPTVNMIVETELHIAGQLQSEHSHLECQQFYFESAATFSSTPSDVKASVLIKADSAIIHGQFQSQALAIDTEQGLFLGETSSLAAKQISLSTLTTLVARGEIKSEQVYVQAQQQIDITSKAKLATSYAYFNSDYVSLQGTLTQCEDLVLYGHNQTRVESGAFIHATKIRLEGNYVVTHGFIESEVLHFHGERVKLAGKMHFDTQEKEDKNTALLFVKAQDCIIDGEIAAQGVYAILANKMYVSHRGKLISSQRHTDKKTTFSSQIRCQEKLYLDTDSLLQSQADLAIHAAKMRVYGRIHPLGNLHLDVISCGEVYQTGRIEAGKNIHIEGGCYWNSGDIKASAHLNIAVDKYFIHGICDFDPMQKFKAGKSLGVLEGQSITVTSAFFLNVLATLSAEHSIQVNAFLDVNVGLVNSKHVSHSSIAAIDLGINITAIESIKGVVRLVRDIAVAGVSSDQEIKSVIREYYEGTDAKSIAMKGMSYALQLASIAAKLLVTFAPHVGIPMEIALNCANLLIQLALNGIAIKQALSKLIEKYQSGQTLHARDFYPLILASKNIALTGAHVVTTGMGMSSTLQHLPEQIQTSHADIFSILPTLAGLFAGSQTTQSVVQLDAFGTTFTGLASTTSAIDVSFFHTNISAVQFQNSFITHQEFGTTLAAMHSISATYYEENHGNKLVSTETLVAEKAVIGGHNQVNTLIMNTKATTLTGDFKAGGGVLQSAHLTTQSAAQVDLSHMSMKIEQADLQAGSLHLTHVVGQVDHFNQGQAQELHLDQSVLKMQQATVAGHGTLNHSYIEATSNMHLTATSEVNLKDSGVKSNEVWVAGHVTFNDSSVEATSNTYLTATSEVALTDSSIKSNDFQQDVGSQLSMQHASIESKDTHLEGDLKSNDAFFKGERMTLAGHVTMDQALVFDEQEKFTITTSGEIQKGKKSELALLVPHFEQKGKVDVDKTELQSSLSSEEVNALCTDQHFKSHELTVMTDQTVMLEKEITSSHVVNIVASTVTNNHTQHLDALHLQATKGDVVVNQAITAQGEVQLCSQAGAVVVNTSIDDLKTEVYGKTGIVFQTPAPVMAPPPQRFGSYTALYEQARYRQETPVPQSMLRSDTVMLQSDADISLKGVNIHATHLGMCAKGDIIFDVNSHRSYSYEPYYVPDYALFNYKTDVVAGDVYIKGRNLINEGQTLLADDITMQLTDSLYNKEQGMLAANHFLWIEAQNVYNTCQVQTESGEYGAHDIYKGSYLLGGDGKDTEGVGLYLHTTGQVINDASHIQSIGSNMILADCGFQSLARSNTYVSYKKDESRFFGLCQTHEERRETIVGRSSVISLQGQNIISSAQGGLKAVATDFCAANRTSIETQGRAEFYDLVAATEVTKASRTMGIFYSKEKSYDEYACPTIISDQKDIQLVSESDIEMRGTLITTPEHLYVKAKNFDYSVSTLKHTYESSSFGVNVTLFNQRILSCHNPNNFNQPAYNSDSILSEINQLASSHGIVDTLLNSWDAAFNLANTGRTLISAVKTKTFPSKELRRELPEIFSPQVGINFTKTHTSTSSESLGDGGISVGNATFDVDCTIKLKGAPVQVLQDFVVDCKNFDVEGEYLRNEIDQKTQNINFTASVPIHYQAGISVNHNNTESIQHINERVQVGGTFEIHATNVNQDGACIDVGHIKGEVDNYRIITCTNEKQDMSSGISISSGGDFSLNRQKSYNKTKSESSQIHVHDSINEHKNEFVVHCLDSSDGEIMSDGKNNFKPETMNFKKVKEEHTNSGFSINGNIKFNSNHKVDFDARGEFNGKFAQLGLKTFSLFKKVEKIGNEFKEIIDQYQGDLNHIRNISQEKT